MKNKIFSLVLALLLMLSITACQNQNNAINGGEIEKTVPENREPQTDKLTIYMNPFCDDLIDRATVEFKRLYPDIELDIIDFGTDLSGARSAYLQTLQTELMSGKGPDLIVSAYFDFPDIRKAIEAGVFYDLDNFLLNDEDFNFDLYNKAVLETGVFNGNRYIMPINYQTPIILTTQENLRAESIDINSFKTFTGFYESIKKYADRHKENNSVFWGQYPEALYMVFPWFGIDFYNFDNKTINLQSDELKIVLDSCKSMYNQRAELNISGYSGDSVIALRNKKCLMELLTSHGIGNFLYDYGALLHDQNPIFFNKPTSDGRTIAQISGFTAINNSSNNKQNAYNFIKILLSPSIQNANDMFSGGADIPVLKSAVEIRVNDTYKNLSGGTPDGSIVIEKIPQEIIDEYIQAITEIDYCVLESWTPIGFLYEAMIPYCEDRSSYESCIAEAKNKLELYMYE